MSDFSIIEGDVTLVSLLGEALATISGVGVGDSPHLDVVSRSYGKSDDTVWVPLKVSSDGSLYISATSSGVNVNLGSDFDDILQVQKDNIWSMGLTPTQEDRHKSNMVMIGAYCSSQQTISPIFLESQSGSFPSLKVSDGKQKDLLNAILIELKRMNIYMSMLMGEEISDACFSDDF